jgi:archaellum biogenesis protein FlaJ (TadC family)
MKSLFYSWIVFQLLIGIWMFISPFVFGFGDTSFATNNMIIGAIVVILGVGTVFYELHHKQRFERETVAGMEHAKERA